MNKKEIIANLIGGKTNSQKKYGEAFAPSNIALCKYWGKRQEQLNLPMTNSLSISLGNKGTYTKIELNYEPRDVVYLNGEVVDCNNKFYVNLVKFLDLFRSQGLSFKITTNSNIPIGAGVASSASGFAAVVKALNDLFAWNLPQSSLSILARLGSGSASRSLWHGFVEWVAGDEVNGLDSFATPLPYSWQDLRIGLLLFSTKPKHISSRMAMSATVKTCPFYSLWPARVATAITEIKAAILTHDFTKFGEITENNAIEMHALMLATKPAIIYSTADTILGMQQIWRAREAGVAVYFTQDAGPNLKLFFLEKEQEKIKDIFPNVEIIDPWDSTVNISHCASSLRGALSKETINA